MIDLNNSNIPKVSVSPNMDTLFDFGLFNLDTLSPLTYFIIGTGVVYLLARYYLKKD